MIYERKTKAETEKIISENEITVVDFFADWCGPCQMFLPVFEKFGKDNTEALVSVNVDDQPMYADQNQVQGIPTIVVFKNGKEAARASGFKSPEQLRELIDSVK